MKNFKLLAEQMFVQPLLDALAAKPELWDAFTDRQAYPGSAHADTRTIILYGPEIVDLWYWFNGLNVKPYPPLDDLGEALYGLTCLMQRILGVHTIEQVGRVMLAELRPGGRITPHCDEGVYAEHFQRIHLVLSGRCEFYCGDEGVTMRPGELWWFNHHERHRVANYMDVPRVNLIMDVRLRPVLGGE